MRQFAQFSMTLGSILLACSQAFAAPPAYTRIPRAAGHHYGVVQGQEARNKYLKAGNAYCNADFRKLVREQAESIEIVPPKKPQWRSGKDYGEYLKHFFDGVCFAFASEFNFRGAGEPCGSVRDFSDEYKEGVEEGEKAFGSYIQTRSAKLGESYCMSDSGGNERETAERARQAFVQALNVPAPGEDGRKKLSGDEAGDRRSGAEIKEFIRGYTLGLCSAFAERSCDDGATATVLREFYKKSVDPNKESAIEGSMRGLHRDSAGSTAGSTSKGSPSAIKAK